ncbi:MAG: excinuclease ABC subunit UvrA, partial [Gammaproteobacteria bacterium]|nr:excinuclease ABC subunit UvrA [Gammaproteobacteria bacterium]
MHEIQIRGARTHNLKNLNLDIPRDKLIVITGLSGSGKSSLAFDTIFAEGQRRYVESLSAYARQFLSMMEKPDIDHIEGLSPAISIEQKTTSHNPRSTVGTVTEIYDYLRLLFARAGTPKCPDHHIPLSAQTISQMVDHVLELPEDTRLMLLAPVIQGRKGEYQSLLDDLKRQGFLRARVDGTVYELDEVPELEKNQKHTIEVVVDRFKVRPDLELRLAESFETAINLTDGVARIAYMDDDVQGRTNVADAGTQRSDDHNKEDIVFSSRFACPTCGYSLNELEPRVFSFNNPAGACGSCDGIGHIQYIDPNRVVTHPTLSLPGGAIRGWDRRNAWYYGMLECLARHYDFDLDTPYIDLPETIQQILLFGSGEDEIEFRYQAGRGEVKIRTHSFEGIIPNMQRRFLETESSAVRDEMVKYFAQQDCPDCAGTRLNKSARHVFVADRTLPEITALSIADCYEFFEQLNLPGNKGEIAEKVVKEISARLRFLV